MMKKTLDKLVTGTALISALAFGFKGQAQEQKKDTINPYEITVVGKDYEKQKQFGDFDYIIPVEDARRISNLVATKENTAPQFASRLVNGARRAGVKPNNHQLLKMGLKKNQDGTWTVTYMVGQEFSQNLGSIEDMRFDRKVDWSIFSTTAKITKYNYIDCLDCPPQEKEEQETETGSRYLRNLGKSITFTGDYFHTPTIDTRAADIFNFGDTRFRLNGRIALGGRISPEVGFYFGFAQDGTHESPKILFEEQLRSGRLARLIETLETIYSNNRNMSAGLNWLVYTNEKFAFSIGGGVGFGNIVLDQKARQEEIYYFNGEEVGRGNLLEPITQIKDVNKTTFSPFAYLEGKSGRFNFGAGVEQGKSIEFREGVPALTDDISIFGRVGFNLGNYEKKK